MHLLAEAGALAPVERHSDGGGEDMAAELVGDGARHVARLATVAHGVQCGEAAHTLDHVVEGRAVSMPPILTEAGGAGMDEPQVARRQRGIGEAEPLGGADPHIVHEHVGAVDKS